MDLKGTRGSMGLLEIVGKGGEEICKKNGRIGKEGRKVIEREWNCNGNTGVFCI